MRRTFQNELTPARLAKIEKLEFKVKALVEGFFSGRHGSHRFGHSDNFAEIRPYEPGDPLRLIDWKAFGRAEALFVRKFHDETNLMAFILLDASASMRFGTAPMNKLEYASCLALALTLILSRQRDATGLMVFDEKERFFMEPGASARQFYQMLDQLENVKAKGRTNMSAALAEINNRAKKRALVVLISDLIDVNDDLRRDLAKLKRNRGDVMALHVMDPAEVSLPKDTSITSLRDPETRKRVPMDDTEMRGYYQRTIAAFIAERQRVIREAGCDYHFINTAHPFDEALRAILNMR